MTGALLRLALGAALAFPPVGAAVAFPLGLVLGTAVAFPPGCCKTMDWMLHKTRPLLTVELTPLTWKEV
jgi:hypothetical protein